MKREILFRGIHADTGEWIYGYGAIDDDILHLDLVMGIVRVKCAKDTVFQFTGLTDKNGKKIFEGDIINDGYGNGLICWVTEHCAFVVKGIENGEIKSYHYLESDGQLKHSEIIGNTFDNPELLEVTP